MAISHWWLGTTSIDPTVAANWSTVGSGGAPGASVPGASNEVQFDGGGNNACTLTENWSLGGLSTAVGYTAKLDMATYDLTITDGGNVTLEQGGEFDMGTGVLSITNGTFDYASLGAFGSLTPGTSVVSFTGTCSWVPKIGSSVYGVIIASGTTTIADSATYFYITSDITINGALLVGTGSIVLHVASAIVMGSGARFGGAGVLGIQGAGTGEGFISRGAGTTIDIARINITPSTTSPTLAPGEYLSAVGIYHTSPIVGLLTMDAGAYAFDSLTLASSNSIGGLVLDTTNATSITIVGTTTIDIDNAANITIDDSGSSCAWDLLGDVVDEITGGGAFVWTLGNSTMLLSGTSDQAINFNNVATPPLRITKLTSGDVTLTDVNLTLRDSCQMAESLIVLSGDVDTHTASIMNINGDVTLSNNQFDMGDDTIWYICGTFDRSGVTTYIPGTSMVVNFCGYTLATFVDLERFQKEGTRICHVDKQGTIYTYDGRVIPLSKGITKTSERWGNRWL